MKIIIPFSFIWLLLLSTSIKGQLPTSFYLNVQATSFSAKYSDDAIYILTNTPKLIKCDFNGNVIWTLSLAGVNKWAINNNSAYVLNIQSQLIRIDSSGNVVWVKDLSAPFCSGSTYNSIWGFTASHEKVFIMSSNDWNGSRGALLVIDSAGTVINFWCDDDQWVDEYNYKIFPSLTGGIWAGMEISPGNGYPQVLVRTDSNGEIDTLAIAPYFNAGPQNNIWEVLPMSDSTYLAVDNATDIGVSLYCNIGLYKFREDGSFVWNKVFSAFGDTCFHVVNATSDSLNNIYLIVFFDDWNHSSYLSIKLNAGGQVLFAKEWTSHSGIQLISFNSFYNRMLFHNNSIYCPVNFLHGPNTFPGFIILDTLMNAECLITTNNTSLAENSPFINSMNWFGYTSYNYSAPDSTISYPFISNPMVDNACIMLDVSSFSENYSLALFPNPANEELTVRSPERMMFIDIINVVGNCKYQTAMNEYIATINTSDLSSGIYIIKILTEKGWSFRRFIVE